MNDNEETAVSHEQLTLTADQLDQLAGFLQELPNPVRIHYWGSPQASPEEMEALRLCQALADHFAPISLHAFPRRANYAYYPVLGIMGEKDGEKVDYGVRIIGLPAGYQITSLIAAIQAVSFQGVTLEPLTRIKLQKLNTDVTLELVTDLEDEGGTLVAKTIFGLAVAHERIQSYLLMSNMFPDTIVRYSVYRVPHLVINGRTHLTGVADEETILQHIGRAVK
ncbi:MAG: thioredoxin family protein [Anaerolineales bacterium]|nr:thioredoxin family protein [Anaerolineales bacterium]